MQEVDGVTQGAETASTPVGRSVRVGHLSVLALGHGVNDGLANAIAPIWPMVRQQFGLTMSGIGLITFWWGLTTNFSQPLFGYLIDRWNPRRLLGAATLVATVFYCTVGYTRNLTWFVVFLLVGGLGVSLYHPRAGALAVKVSGGRKALGMGVFTAGGSVGMAAGYLLSPYLCELVGSTKGLLYAAPVGLVTAALLWGVGSQDGQRSADQGFDFHQDVLPHLGKLLPLSLVMILRASTVVAFCNFLPLLLAAQGRQLVAGGYSGFFFTAGGAIGSMIGGHISDRLGRRGITIVSMLLSPAFVYLALQSTQRPGLLCLFLALFAMGLVLRAAEAVNITHTQELLPRATSLASSLGMGLAWGFAGLVAPLLGILADRHGVDYALSLVVWLPLVAGLIALGIPRTTGTAKSAG
jgi:FSR family fosmidomycin resistance protein-like MFS transporter